MSYADRSDSQRRSAATAPTAGLIQHIDHIAAQPGVLSIRVCVPGQIGHRGDHEEALRLAMLQRDELNIDRTSTAAGKITIMVQREPGGTAAIAVVTGHEIRKSLRRMIHRCAKVKAATPIAPCPEAKCTGSLQHGTAGNLGTADFCSTCGWTDAIKERGCRSATRDSNGAPL